jgi:AraC-like DNA-binding protein
MVQDLHLRGTIPRQQVTDLKLGMAFKFPRYLADRAIKPVEVSIRHANKKHLQAYAKYFECPVKLAQTENKISFKLRDLEIPVKSSDAFLHELAEYHIGMETLGLNTDRVTQTRMLISRLLATNECTLPKVAAKLLLHERTLQRQLKASGSNFQQLVDEVRKERALTYLDIPNMPIAKVAELLGFEEQSSFNKAFQRWRNERPSDYRRQP